MGVHGSLRLCALLVLGAGLAAGSACKDDPDDPESGGITGLTKDGPNGKLPVQSSIPGLEPPVTTPRAGTTGGAAGSPASPTTGAGASSQNPNPGMTPGVGTAGGVAAGSGGETGAAGSGGFGNAAGAGAAGQMTDPMTGADAGMGDPCAKPTCGIDQPCDDGSLHCIKLDSCENAVCISTQAACQAECGTTSCAILESYPEQIGCE